MEIPELVKALRRNMVETGSLVCFACGHEHNCSTHGCAILRAAADALESIAAKHNGYQEPLTVTLPCKVGDAVYSIGIGKVVESRVRTFWMGEISGLSHLVMIRTTRYDIEADQIGKTVFLTREAAEQALNARKPEESKK